MKKKKTWWGEFGRYGSKVVTHPEWEKIRLELCGLDITDLKLERVNLGGGLSVYMGDGFATEEEAEKSKLWSRLCWFVNNGPGYCAEAPEDIKVLLRRLDLM